MAVAYLVLAWPIGTAAQFALIVLVSLAATLALYDLGVRRERSSGSPLKTPRSSRYSSRPTPLGSRK